MISRKALACFVLLHISTSVAFAGGATVSYTETAVGAGLSQYQFIVANTFDTTIKQGYSLVSVKLLISGAPKMLLAAPGWDSLQSNEGIEVFSTFAGSPPTGSDIPAGTSQSGFFLLAASALRSISFTASFSNPQSPGVFITQDGTASFIAAAPPTISSVTATPDALWPPNHKMIPVALNAVVSSAAACRITSVSSNEGATAPGEPDWAVIAPLRVELRAERSGSSAGRVYSVTVSCTNISNLTSSRLVTVTVPHDRRK